MIVWVCVSRSVMPDSLQLHGLCQTSLSMEFSRQEYWSGKPSPPPRDLPDPGIKPTSPALQVDSLRLSHRGSPAKVWKQPKCPSTNEWIKKMWSIYTMEYHRKNEIMPFAATWMDLEIIVSEVSQKDKYHMISLICGIWNMIQMNLLTKQKQTHRHRK